MQNVGVYGRRPVTQTNKVASIFLPSRGKKHNKNRKETSTSATTSSRKGVLDYLHNLAYCVESRYLCARELATDAHTLYRRLASTAPSTDRYSNTGNTDSQSASPSVTPNYDVIDPDIVLVTNLQCRDAVLTLGCSLLLIQQHKRTLPLKKCYI